MTKQKIKHQKRIRVCHADLETLRDSLEHYMKFLNEELAQHEDDKTRFTHPSRWLRKREKLNLLLTRAKHINTKILSNLKDLVGRTEATKNLLHLTTEDMTGEYISFSEAWRLPFLRSCGFDEAQNLLFNAYDKGIIHGFRDNEDKLVKFKKIDILRLIAYAESHT